jgi:hypothetical protein
LPIIAPFHFGDDELNENDLVIVTCAITKGDLPVSIWWRFTQTDDSMAYNLTSNDGIVISRNSQKVSVLLIEAVQARHRGSFTCFAQNKGGFSQYSAYLAMNG